MKHSVRQLPPFRRHPVSLFVLAVLSVGAAGSGWAEESATKVAEVQFNESFIRTSGQPIDISRFARGNVASPGQYRADVYVNMGWTGRVDISLRTPEGGQGQPQPCFDRGLLDRIGVDLAKLKPEALALLAQGARCTLLSELIPDAVAAFDLGEQRLDISVPQIAMRRSARGYVAPEFWDDGITAARLGYNANVYHSDATGHASTQAYVGVDAGVNVGAWRLRHTGNYTNGSASEGGRYQSVQTNLQRSIVPLKSQLVIGDAFTDGAVFDSVGLRGVKLATDDRMLPDSQRGYAPVVHGIAYSNARVQVRQGGNILYEATVAAGAFEINDLYATGYGGDLEVVVTEADGSVRVSKVPYAAPVNSVREGVTRYSVAGGQYRNPAVHSTPWMVQGTVQHGFTNTVTAYGGATLAEGYDAAVGGMALNTEYGAFGADLTYAKTSLNHQPDQQGVSARLSYSKLLAPTDTNVTLAAYRYSSKGYLGLQDAMLVQDADRLGADQPMDSVPRARGRLQLMLNQSLPQGYGNLYVSGSTTEYWNQAGRDTQFQVGYNNHYKTVNYGISAARQFDPIARKWDNRVMFTVGIPLGTKPYAPYSSTTVQKDSSGTASVQESISGTLGEDNAVNYGLSASHSAGGDTQTQTDVSAYVNYLSPVAQLGASVSRGQGYTQAGMSVSGGVVAYSGGVAFTPVLGEATAIVEAPDAAGARVSNGPGLRVDPWGHAVVSSLTPFARNQVEIDPKGLPLNVELRSTVQQVAPTAGAVVRVKFDTENTGRFAVLRLSTVDNQLVPFGAAVADASGAILGTVAQGGRVIVSGLKADHGELTVTWGNQAHEACRANYTLPPTNADHSQSLVTVAASCQPAAVMSASTADASSSH